MESVFFASTQHTNLIEASSDLTAQLPTQNYALIIFFSTDAHDLAEVAKVLQTIVSDSTPIIGCTTAGEIGPNGYLENSIVVLGFSAKDFCASTLLLRDLENFDASQCQLLIADLIHRSSLQRESLNFSRVFAFTLIDGMSLREEAFGRALQVMLSDIPLFGGSAGDSLKFRKTFVSHGTEVESNAAVVAIIATHLPFRLIKTQHFRKSGERMVITCARPKVREVAEINGRPAALEYARAIGVALKDLSSPTFASNPVVVRIGGQEYVRSIQRVNADNSLTFYCAIDEGIVLYPAQALDPVATLKQTLEGAAQDIGPIQAGIGCDCVLRRLEFQQSDTITEISRVLREHHMLGFSTYGELYMGIHMNQTLTGIVFGYPTELEVTLTQSAIQPRNEKMANCAREFKEEMERRDKIIQVLMERVEQSMDAQESDYSFFQTTVLLGEQVRERTRQFDELMQILQQKNTELAHAKAIAEEAAKIKSDFLANMSHEIRTPLNAVIGLAHLALKTELSPRQRDYLQKIQQSGQHLLGIINDILDFSKIEAGKLTIEYTDFELDKLLDNVADLIAEKATHKGLELIFDLAPDVPLKLVGDPLRISQILINFANNAVKFTEHGEVTVIVRVRERTEKNILLWFGIQDTGIGLDEEQKNYLFQSFQQADSTISRKYGGTGLGLAISKRLAQLMGGEVGVESVKNKGSTFWFTTRLAPSETQERKLILRADLSGKRILVADDNDHARLVLKELLENMSFAATTCASAAEAISLIQDAADQDKPFEVVLLDWRMPDLNGIDAAKQIKELNLANPPHIVLVTAYGRDEIVRAAESIGVRDIVLKPVNTSLLFDTLASLFHARHADTKKQDLAAVNSPTILATLKGARILLAEDSKINQQVTSELLAEVGLQIEIAENGLQALEMAQANHYDLILMDMQMPEMDGLEATRALRVLPALSYLPIIAMTANAMESDKVRCLEAGMNDFVTKPINPDELWATLLRWLKPTPVQNTTHLNPEKKLFADEETPTKLPDKIDGLDLAAGLHHVLNKKKLYRQLLTSFIAEQGNICADLDNALTQGDMKTAERLTHTLKGMAGNLGANQLQEDASLLEQAIRQDEATEQIGQKLATLKTTLSSQADAIRHALALFPEVSKPAALTPQLHHVCQQLISFLTDCDGQAEVLFTENAGLLLAAFPSHFKRLEVAIQKFNYGQAITVLKEAMEIT